MLYEALIDQFEGAVEYNEAGKTPYTPLKVVGIAYQLIFNTGMFNDDCKLWKQQDPDNNTRTEFNFFFATANQELRKSQATTAGSGYHAANYVDHQAANRVYRQETINTIANLDTATVSDRASVVTVTVTNSNLASALTLSNSKLVTALQDVARLTGTIAELRQKLENTNTATRPEVGWSKSH